MTCKHGHEGRLVARSDRANGYRCLECARLDCERRRRLRGVSERGSAECFARLSARPNRPTGEGHHAWKGDEVGYFACHQWLQKHYPLVGKCDLCGKEKRTEFVYKGCPGGWKRDRDVYHEACHSCNRLLDNYLRENLSAVG